MQITYDNMITDIVDYSASRSLQEYHLLYEVFFSVCRCFSNKARPKRNDEGHIYEKEKDPIPNISIQQKIPRFDNIVKVYGSICRGIFKIYD